MNQDLKQSIIHKEFEFWECSCRMSKDRLYGMLYAVIMHNGSILSTFTIGCEQYTKSQNSYNDCFFIIKLPKGAKASFENMSGVKLASQQEVKANSQGDNK